MCYSRNMVYLYCSVQAGIALLKILFTLVVYSSHTNYWQEIRKRGLKVSVAGVPKTIDNDIAVIFCKICLLSMQKPSLYTLLIWPLICECDMQNLLIFRSSTSPLVLIRLWKRPSAPLIQLTWKLAVLRME
jgi:hypothetical protein